MIFYDYRDAIANNNVLRGLTIFPSFSLISEAYNFMYEPKCEVNLIPALMMFIYLVVNNRLFTIVERRIHNFNFYKDPYIVEVEMITDQASDQAVGGINGMDSGNKDVQYMSARPHAHTNYDYEDVEAATYGSELKISSPSKKGVKSTKNASRTSSLNNESLKRRTTSKSIGKSLKKQTLNQMKTI